MNTVTPNVRHTTTQPDAPIDRLGYEVEDDDAMYIQRSPSSARRYQPPTGTPAAQQKKRYIPHPDQEIDIERNTTVGQQPRKVRFRRTRYLLKNGHWLFYLGVGMLGMVLLWIGLTSLVSWVLLQKDNFTYGMPRTFQINAVIGQGGDSQGDPTHIIFLNNARKVQVIVMPPDTSKSQIYTITTMVEEGSELFPITGYVKDVNGDGKPDIIIDIKGSKTVLINTGDKFRQMQPGDHITP